MDIVSPVTVLLTVVGLLQGYNIYQARCLQDNMKDMVTKEQCNERRENDKECTNSIGKRLDYHSHNGDGKVKYNPVPDTR